MRNKFLLWNRPQSILFMFMIFIHLYIADFPTGLNLICKNKRVQRVLQRFGRNILNKL